MVEIRKIDPDAVVVASSGYSNDPIIARPRDFGFSDSIAKPFQMKQLMELVVRCLGKKSGS
jgi:DNA-binding NtrC family response regulator